MSKTIRKSADYIRLLLSSTKKQARAFLKVANTDQIEAVSELVYNLLTLTVPHKTKKLIKKCEKVFKRLAKKHLSPKSKLRIILSHFGLILTILLALKPILLELLQ